MTSSVSTALTVDVASPTAGISAVPTATVSASTERTVVMTISSDDRTGTVQSSLPINSVRNADRLPQLGDIIIVWFPYDTRLPRHAAIVASEVDPNTGAFDIVIFTMSMFKEGGTYRAISYVGQRGDSWDFKS